jgi:hypothetical protein
MNAFPPTGRYADVEVTHLTTPNGRIIGYLRRRRIPQPESLATVGERAVRADDRIDTLAARLLGDPTQFWRLCDANAVLDAEALVAEPGRVVRIALPEGVPGGPDA